MTFSWIWAQAAFSGFWRQGVGVHLNLNLNQLRLDQLQEAIRDNRVGFFPSQVPVFIKHAHGKLQCHAVLL